MKRILMIIYITLLIMLPNILQAQTNNTYQAVVPEYPSDRIIFAGGGPPPPFITYYSLRFTADSVGICSHTIATATNTTSAFSDWQYFKWQMHQNELLITKLPSSYQELDTLRINRTPDTSLITVKNKSITFYNYQTYPVQPGDAVIGKSYAINIGDNGYLALTFDKNSVELTSWKNIDPKAKILEYDETQKPKKYSWIRYGQHIFIPGFEQSPMLIFVRHKLCIRYNSNFYMAKEMSYRQPVVCYTIVAMMAKKQSKRELETQPPITIGVVYGPKHTKGFIAF